MLILDERGTCHPRSLAIVTYPESLIGFFARLPRLTFLSWKQLPSRTGDAMEKKRKKNTLPAPLIILCERKLGRRHAA